MEDIQEDAGQVAGLRALEAFQDKFLTAFARDAAARSISLSSLSVDRIAPRWGNPCLSRVYVSGTDFSGQFFDAPTATEAMDAAWVWLRAYRPREEQLAEILGISLLQAAE